MGLKAVVGRGSSAASGITIGTSVITSGTNTRVLFDDSGVVGESAGLTYVKGTGTLTATVFAGAGTGLTGTAASLSIGGNAATVTTLTVGTTTLTSGTTTRVLYNLAGVLQETSTLLINATAGQGPSIVAGTATTAVSPLSITQTWNASGVVFPGIVYNVTDTASATGRTFWDMQISGTSMAKVYIVNSSNNTTLLEMHGQATNKACGLYLYDGPDSANAAAAVFGIATAGTWFGTGSALVIGSNKSGTGTQKPIVIGGYNGSAWVDWVQISTAGATGFGALPFGGAATVTGALDAAFSRIGAGIIGVGTGAAGSVAGTLDATLYKAAGTAGVATFGPAAVASITIKGGLVTAIS